MSTTFRIVHFVPDPISGARLPVAALMNEGGRVRLVTATSLPTTGCVGTQSAKNNMHHVLQTLARADQIDRLPLSIGPLAVLDAEPHNVPEGIADSAAWVQTNVLPHREARSPLPRSSERTTDRVELATDFLDENGVGSLVQRHVEAREFLPALRAPVDPISQCVRGPDRVLLLEPIFAPKHAVLREQLREISGRFLAWQSLMRRASVQREFVAYVLPNGGSWEEAEDTLQEDTGARVLDVSSAEQLNRLLQSIRSTAAASV